MFKGGKDHCKQAIVSFTQRKRTVTFSALWCLWLDQFCGKARQRSARGKSLCHIRNGLFGFPPGTLMWLPSRIPIAPRNLRLYTTWNISITLDFPTQVWLCRPSVICDCIVSQAFASDRTKAHTSNLGTVVRSAQIVFGEVSIDDWPKKCCQTTSWLHPRLESQRPCYRIRKKLGFSQNTTLEFASIQVARAGKGITSWTRARYRNDPARCLVPCAVTVLRFACFAPIGLRASVWRVLAE